MTILELAGSRREMGEAHGEARRDEIQGACAVLDDSLAAHTPGLTADRLDDVGTRLTHACEIAAPDEWAELSGIAAAATVELHRLVLLNSFGDLLSILREDPSSELPALGGCTLVVVRTPEGVVIAQTFDMPAAFAPYVAVTVRRPTHGSAAVGGSFWGTLPLCGLSDAGIAAAVNFLTTTEWSYGAPMPVLMSRLLTAPSIGEALGAVVVGPRAGGMHYAIASDDVAFSVEATAVRTRVSSIEEEVFSHANHACQPDVRAAEPRFTSPTSAHTYVREARIAGRISVDQPASLREFLACFSDHVNEPRGVCYHGDDAESELTRGRTHFTLVARPRSGEVLFAEGLPCSAETFSIQLEPLGVA